MLAIVGELAARHGFDPAELINPKTGPSLGPALGRMRGAFERSGQHRVAGEGTRADQPSSESFR